MLEGGLSAQHRFTILAALVFAACGSEPDVVRTTFSDELVEAAGRTADLTVVNGGSCEALLSVLHAEAADVGFVVANQRTAYPIAPEADVLVGVPRGTPIAIDVVVLDDRENVVARGCVETSLAAGEPADVEVEMHALPFCEASYMTVDIAIVLDASSAMQLVDTAFGNTVTDELKNFMDLGGFPPETRFSLLTHGPDAPMQLIAPTTDREAIKQGFEDYRGVSAGDAQTFDAVLLASERLRSRAVCRRRPAMLAIGGGQDVGQLGDFDNAIIGIAGARGETRDDVYTFAIALTMEAKTDFDDLVTDNDLGEVMSAGTGSSFANALSEARYRFQGLVGP